MRILLLGRSGQVGWELARALTTVGEVTALGREQADLTDAEGLRHMVRAAAPQVVVNAAAYNAVDRAEEEPEVAMAVNGHAPGVLAEACLEAGAALVHFSTDYVFDGRKGAPYTEDDPTHPLSVYGRSKLEGERRVLESGCPCLVLRTAWVYSLRRPCFVTRLLEWAKSREALQIAEDQVGSPTWARTLAEAVAQVLAQSQGDPAGLLREKGGLYHLAGAGAVSRYRWACATLEHAPGRREFRVREVRPVPASTFPTPAARPPYSALDCTRFERTFGLRVPPWEEALRLALEAG